MTGKERTLNALERKPPVDQLPVCDSLWVETLRRWIAEGHISANENSDDHFGFDIMRGCGLNSTADPGFKNVILEESDTSMLQLNGNGATLRIPKNSTGTPEHVGFSVKSRHDWEEKIKPFLIDIDRRRIPSQIYREQKKRADEKQLFLTVGGLAPFEQMHPVCGHENLLMGMALDPDWIMDMVETYVNLTINHFEIIFHEDGLPDAVWLSEDLGFKDHPFMSPAMYKELLLPGHKKLFDFFHSKKLKVIVHSCGYVEPLVPCLIEAGMDCLQAMEAKAGMDMPRLFKNYGDKISFCGNIDVTIMLKNNIEELEKELRRKILPVIKNGGGYILHSDHSIPPQVDYETFRFFVDEGRKLIK